MKRIDPRRLVFIDESGANLAMGRSHAWVLRGEEYVEPRPMNWGDNLSLIGAVRLGGWVTLGTQWKAVTAKDFTAWVRDRLAPRLQPGDIVLLDNLRAHKAAAIADFMQEPPFHGRRPVCLGDDVTDECAFEFANTMGGLSIAVGVTRESSARAHLQTVAAARLWLRRASRSAL